MPARLPIGTGLLQCNARHFCNNTLLPYHCAGYVSVPTSAKIMAPNGTVEVVDGISTVLVRQF